MGQEILRGWVVAGQCVSARVGGGRVGVRGGGAGSGAVWVVGACGAGVLACVLR